ncbi:hypothetical protein CEP51_009371 [Fusarium floridanum]|uniref:Uncharacterized protein n=1 Tax=Fusarium floridanum TaxID=1325733 RepID=A0A428RHV8_9HYPO|nr:hypothetical protein CEP51_009371 [Fusarium floridanum]
MNCTIASIMSFQEIGVVPDFTDVKEHSGYSTESFIDIMKEDRLIGAIQFSIRTRSISIKPYHMITTDR